MDHQNIDTKIYKRLKRRFLSNGGSGLHAVQLMEEYKRIGTNMIYDTLTRNSCMTRYNALKKGLKPQSEPEIKRQPKSFNDGVFIKNYTN